MFGVFSLFFWVLGIFWGVKSWGRLGFFVRVICFMSIVFFLIL